MVKNVSHEFSTVTDIGCTTPKPGKKAKDEKRGGEKAWQGETSSSGGGAEQKKVN